jgi:hypothetical protein
MKDIECPRCGAYSIYTRRTCHKCGASLVDSSSSKEPASTRRQPSWQGEGVAVLAGAFAGVFLVAVTWFVFFFSAVWETLFGWMDYQDAIFPVISGLTLLLGLFWGAAGGDYLFWRDRDVRGWSAVNWAAAAAPLVAFLAALLLALGIFINFNLFSIWLLPFAAVPAAVFAVLYAQQKRLQL